MSEGIVHNTPSRMKSNTSLFFKIAFVAVIALLMLIPLSMVKSLVRERQNYADGCRAEVAQSWGNAQTLSGPAIEFSYDQEETDADGKKLVRHMKKIVYPKDLHYDIAASTQKLHRSIYDVMVYRSDVTAEGSFVIPKDMAGLDIKSAFVTLGISDLRGIEGNVDLSLDGQDYIFSEGSAGGREEMAHIRESLSLDRLQMDGATVLPFSLHFKMKGSETLSVRPYGELTEVQVHSDKGRCLSHPFHTEWICFPPALFQKPCRAGPSAVLPRPGSRTRSADRGPDFRCRDSVRRS